MPGARLHTTRIGVVQQRLLSDRMGRASVRELDVFTWPHHDLWTLVFSEFLEHGMLVFSRVEYAITLIGSAFGEKSAVAIEARFGLPCGISPPCLDVLCPIASNSGYLAGL